MELNSLDRISVPSLVGLTLFRFPSREGWGLVRLEEVDAFSSRLMQIQADHEQQLSDMRTTLADARDTVALAMRQRESDEKRIHELEQLVAKLTSSLDQANEQNRAEKAARKKKEEEAARLKESLAQANEAREQSKLEVEAVRAEVSEIMNQASAVLEQNKELQEALDTSEKKLTKALAQLSQNYTNSGISSLYSPNHKTIHNSRPSTNNKPGGQYLHKGSSLKPQEPDKTENVESTPNFLDDTRYEDTGKTAWAQELEIEVSTVVTDYYSKIYRNLETGKEEYAPFPHGLRAGMNYGPKLKTFVFELTNYCNVSIDKTVDLLKDVSGGRIHLSKGFVSGLNEEFSDKSVDERQTTFNRVQQADVKHADYTSIRSQKGGESTRAAILIVADTEGNIYFKDCTKKGHEGIKGSPLEGNTGSVVSDSEATFVNNYGDKHQRCLAHIQRDCASIVENEESEWASDLKKWCSESVHFWHEFHRGNIEESDVQSRTDKLIGDLEAIRDSAAKVYKDDKVPKPGFTKGINLYRALRDHMDQFTLFLRDKNVPPTNNLAEQCARSAKRKEHAAGTLRSQSSVRYFCNGQTIILSAIKQKKELFSEILRIFSKPLARKTRGKNKKHMSAILEELQRAESMSDEEGSVEA